MGRRAFAVAAAVIAMTATADARKLLPQSPEAQVRQLVGALCENTQAASLVKKLVTPDAMIVHGGVVDPSGDLSELGDMNIHAPSTVAVTLDTTRHAAWFQAVAEGRPIDRGDHESTAWSKRTLHMHVSGLALEQPDHSWKIAAIALDETMTDRAMIAQTKTPGYPGWGMPSDAEIVGEKDLANAIAGWFSSGKLAKSALAGTVYAAGSAPDELGAGDAATKLAKKWDEMKLGVARVSARILDGGFGVAFVTVRWKYKEQVIGFDLTVVAVKEGDTWKWIVLDFVV